MSNSPACSVCSVEAARFICSGWKVRPVILLAGLGPGPFACYKRPTRRRGSLALSLRPLRRFLFSAPPTPVLIFSPYPSPGSVLSFLSLITTLPLRVLASSSFAAAATGHSLLLRVGDTDPSFRPDRAGRLLGSEALLRRSRPRDPDESRTRELMSLSNSADVPADERADSSSSFSSIELL